jgi:hypothetical protein
MIPVSGIVEPNRLSDFAKALGRNSRRQSPSVIPENDELKSAGPEPAFPIDSGRVDRGDMRRDYPKAARTD